MELILLGLILIVISAAECERRYEDDEKAFYQEYKDEDNYIESIISDSSNPSVGYYITIDGMYMGCETSRVKAYKEFKKLYISKREYHSQEKKI